MALVHMRDMLRHAFENNYAVGAFDLVSLDFLEAVIDAAERCRAPVILSVAEPHFAHYDIELMMPAVEAAARRAEVPVAIQLDHGASLESAARAINLGCNGVMLDASSRELPDNISATKAVVDMAHACGVPVTGELGHVGEGKDSNEHSPLTIPSEAKAYVERTGVDFLAVSIGNVQGCNKGRTKLDFARLKQLKHNLNIPLVIHGGSGLDEEQYRRLSAHGISMINYFTRLSEVAAEAMRSQAKEPSRGSFIKLKQGVKEAVGDEAERCMRLFGSAGRAAETLAQCGSWAPVEHLIIYNLDKVSDEQTYAMIAEGRRVLSQIPGVREVFSGEMCREGGKYRFSWLVRFCHPAVIDSYREHPEHVKFADTHFRPIAGDRISIDYQEVVAGAPAMEKSWGQVSGFS